MFSRKGMQSRACSIILAPLSIEIDVSNNGLISRNFSTPYFFAKYKAVMIVAGCSHSAISILMGDDLSMYFKIIHNLTKVGGYFLCINRYYKDTVGYPIEMNSYPYDKFWKVLISKTSWMQDHIHFLLTQRVKSESLEILEELKNIKNKSNIIRKSDPFFFRRNIPPFIYRFYKKTKFFFLSR